MAEVRSRSGQVVGGLPQAHPDEAEIRSQNAQRIARRKQAAALSLIVQRTSGENLDRFGETRRVGGTFETLQAIPERRAPKHVGLQLKDLASLIEALSFQSRERVLGSNSFLSSFGPSILGLTSNRRIQNDDA